MLQVFAADDSDIEWISQLYIESARDKHFNIDITLDENINFIKRNIDSMVLQQQLVDFGLETQTLVFEHAGNRIGYAVISSVRGDMESVEIHLLVVDKQYRGNHFGRRMLDLIIERWHPHTNIYARCYPASWLMMEMLLRSGFSYSTELEDNSRLYFLACSSTNILNSHKTYSHHVQH